LRIVFLNWRDLAHPRSGGAEVLSQGLASRLAAAGHDVTYYSARVAGRADDEMVDGLKHVRRGGRYGVYREAYAWLRGSGIEYDLLIDHINTVPFFTPLYERARSIALVPQLARDVWWYEAPAAMAAAGVVAERVYHTAYHSTPGITISPSSYNDLRGFGWRGALRTIAMPVDQREPSAEKERRPTLLFVGRLTPSKRLEDAIDAFKVVRAQVPDAQLWITGAADDRHYERRVRERAASSPDIHFMGRVDQRERQRLMSAAHLLLATSVREGWGLVVTEANILGTPAVGYAVPGLRDSIKRGLGTLVPSGDARALGNAAAQLLFDHPRLSAMSANARADAAQYSWERTYNEFVAAILELRPEVSAALRP
jgi:glycosyltransferase involved in cell wall biosynthesis